MGDVTPNKITPEIKAKLDARNKARTDKLFLATEVLGYDFQPDVHAELFEQYVPFNPANPWASQSDIKNRLILWPRGHFKSTSVVVEVIQAILNFPDLRVLLMQGTLKTTRLLLKEIASHFQGTALNSKLTELFPEFCGDKKALQLTGESFTTPARQKKQLQQPTVAVASPRSTKTGQHYDVGFFDDLINDQNYRNPRLLKKAEEDFQMCSPLIDPGGYRYVTGTRYAFGDLYENIQRNNKGEWVVSVKTCWTDDGKEVRFPQRKKRDSDELCGFTREELLQKQADNPAIFASQFLNRPIAEGEQVFTEEMMLGACIAPDKAGPLSQSVLFIDLAATNAEYSDDSCIIAGKLDATARMYVVDVRGGKWLAPQTALNVLDMALIHRPLKIMVEKTASSAFFVPYLEMLAAQKGMRLPIEEIPVSNIKDAKQVRISALQGYINQKRLFFFAGLNRWDKVVQQFVEFPKGRNGHDDYPDTIALMVNEFTKNTRPMRCPRCATPFIHAIETQGSDISKAVLDTKQPSEYEGAGGEFD